MNFIPWAQIGPTGALLVATYDNGRAARLTNVRVVPTHPRCAGSCEHTWTGYGFPRHPAWIALVCVRCWDVERFIDRDPD